ncbi:MAG: HAD family hydrolase [Acutalibacteraceae bacterium]
MIKAVIFDMFETLITHYESPLYFGSDIAADAGISESEFQKIWRPAEERRMTGGVTLKELLEEILKENGCFSDELLSALVQKRILAKEEVFLHLHPEIIPMLQKLKDRGMRLGLVSNCYSEEVEVIKNSVLYPYFDAVCLSYTEKVMKPDLEIFRRCLKRLGVNAQECLYIGDGGSNELEAAQSLGMHALQAVWYLQAHTYKPTERKPDFEALHSPLEILNFIRC